ncbi:MAG: hypothetical protein J0L56_09270 [Chitinophagales bacterium]|nr:hypothetical protein [Chitinophagales bacterium]
MKKIAMLMVIFLTMILPGISQKADTVVIDASKIDTRVLIPGTHRYLVYFKLGKDSSRKMYQLWSRSIAFIQYENKEAVSVTQEWEDNDTVVHKTYSVLNRDDFATLYHESWWKKTGKATFDFLKKEAKDRDILLNRKTDSNSIKQQKAFESACSQYFLNWHLDLEVFPLLPYKDGVTFRINFYDPGFGPPKYVDYTVVGSGNLPGFNNQKIDCWLLRHGSLPRNQETFWISKQTREVLKLEQEFAGSRGRYKIKLGFSY